MRFRCWWLCLALTITGLANADEVTIFEGPYHLSVAPEVYHLLRTKEGGARQKGVLGGVQGSLERWRPNGIYWGIEGSCASGRMRGRTPRGAEIVSRLTEKQIEGRLGYHFAADSNRFLLVPFILAGQYECENKYISPSPNLTTFNDHFDFAGCGFYLLCNLTSDFSYGFTWKSRYMLNGWDDMSDHPTMEDVQTRIKSEWQYDAEFPLMYGSSYQGWAVQIVPFYRFRHFGGMEAYPLDFIETKFSIYGAKFVLMRSF